MLIAKVRKPWVYAILMLSFIATCNLSLASVNFIHTSENLYQTMYIKDKKVYLQRCNPQTTIDFDEKCDTSYNPKSIESLDSYLDKLNFPTGSFQKKDGSKLSLDKAIEEATKLGSAGNAKAKAKVSELNKFLDNLNIVLDFKNKLVEPRQTDNSQDVLFDFSPYYSEFLEPFRNVDEDPETTQLVNKIPDMTQEQFIDNFNKGISMTFDEIPEDVLIKGKQFKFLNYNFDVHTWRYHVETKRHYKKLPWSWTKKTSVVFYDRSLEGFSNPKINFLPSVENYDDFEQKKSSRYDVLPLNIKEDDKGVYFFKDVTQHLELLDYRCPLNLKVKKIKKENSAHSFILIWMEAVDEPNSPYGICTSVVPSNLTNLIIGFDGIIENKS